ncbi:MAG: glycosyltransferase family 2 protein [Atopobiaceae bacterium]|nr:glycosyltransferase family 2 protein [Atopobiaceae bacterium]
MPVLSICVACYNVEDVLPRAIESYEDERLRGRIEALLVDDGSTDGTAGLIDAACSREPSIFRAIHKENGGHGSALNAAMDAFQGRWFRVIDGDDWVDTEELIRFLDALEGIDADIVIDGRVEVDMKSGTERRVRIPSDVVRGVPVDFDAVFADMDRAPILAMHTITLSRDLLDRAPISLLEHCFYVDTQFVLEAARDARHVAFVDTLAYCYRLGTASQSVADAGYVKHFDDHTRVCEKVLSLLDDARSMDFVHRRFLEQRAKLLVETHYNIALIFDPERKRGADRAKAFRSWLSEAYPSVAKAAEKRYRLASILHLLGVDSQEKLDRLTGRLRG